MFLTPEQFENLERYNQAQQIQASKSISQVLEEAFGTSARNNPDILYSDLLDDKWSDLEVFKQENVEIFLKGLIEGSEVKMSPQSVTLDALECLEFEEFHVSFVNKILSLADMYEFASLKVLNMQDSRPDSEDLDSVSRIADSLKRQCLRRIGLGIGRGFKTLSVEDRLAVLSGEILLGVQPDVDDDDDDFAHITNPRAYQLGRTWAQRIREFRGSWVSTFSLFVHSLYQRLKSAIEAEEFPAWLCRSWAYMASVFSTGKEPSVLFLHETSSYRNPVAWQTRTSMSILNLGDDTTREMLHTLEDLTTDLWVSFDSIASIQNFVSEDGRKFWATEANLAFICTLFVKVEEGSYSFLSPFGYAELSKPLEAISLKFGEILKGLQENPYLDRGYYRSNQTPLSHEQFWLILSYLAIAKLLRKQRRSLLKKIEVSFEGDTESSIYESFVDGLAAFLIDESFPKISYQFSDDAGEVIYNSHPLYQWSLNGYLNGMGASTYDFLNLAAVYLQKASNTGFGFDFELLDSILNVSQSLPSVELSDAEVSGDFSKKNSILQLCLGAVVLSVLPATEYDKITRLEARNFEYVQNIAKDYFNNKFSFKGDLLIDQYLTMESDSIKDLSYLEWSFRLITGYMEEGGKVKGTVDMLSFMRQRNQPLSDSDIPELQQFQIFLGDEIFSRNFKQLSLSIRGNKYAFEEENGVVPQIALADDFRRSILQLEGFDELKPEIIELQDGFFMAALPRFHPLWWIIGSVSIANCCMVPDNAGYTSSRSGFWGNRDRSFIIFHKESQTVVGSLQLVGAVLQKAWGELGEQYPEDVTSLMNRWIWTFDGVEGRNEQKMDKSENKQALQKFDETFAEMLTPWLAKNAPLLSNKNKGYSRYVEYYSNNKRLEVLSQIGVVVSDEGQAYRDFAKNPFFPAWLLDKYRLHR